MAIFLTVVGIIIALVSLIYAKKSYSKEYGDDKRKELIDKLNYDLFVTRALSKVCSKTIEDLIMEYDLGDAIFIDAITYNQYYKALIHSQETNLKEDVVSNAPDLPNHIIIEMIESVNKQQNELKQIHTHLEIVKHNLVNDYGKP
ncbi:hypothetical protein F0358_10500 [Empedobacter brevis]|uniref:hypothetical protein n=1 Tax=Empedobacter brevis TaxID=247 RepID=UPI00123C9FF4|nr:hypothetical protein [Empedobacter brevis]QES93104.1 hypothetical protein F0358_10500 [Empedobacter brevis]